ncbi:MAG: hypothetical protein OXH56_10350 [Gemmatimonadetes bacterium]|nr:hypothetical protein [Gemmatimonadota bacterium]
MTNKKPNNDVGEDNPPANLAEAIRARFAPLGCVELEIPPRESMRDPPDFECDDRSMLTETRSI